MNRFINIEGELINLDMCKHISRSTEGIGSKKIHLISIDCYPFRFFPECSEWTDSEEYYSESKEIADKYWKEINEKLGL